jgi:hypothetical protein
VIDLPTDRRPFDMARVARRDALVRNLIWISLILIGAAIAVVVAAR